MKDVAVEIIASVVSAAFFMLVGWMFRQHLISQIRKNFFSALCFGIENVFSKRLEAQQEIDQKLVQASRIKLLGVQGMALFSDVRMVKRASLGKAIFEQRIPKDIQILLLDPDSEYVAQRANELGVHSAEDIKQGILHTISDIKLLKDEAPDMSIEVRTYNAPPIWSLIFLDEILYVSSYAKGIPGYESRCYRVRARRGSLYYVFEKYFEYMWSIAVKQ